MAQIPGFADVSDVSSKIEHIEPAKHIAPGNSYFAGGMAIDVAPFGIEKWAFSVLGKLSLALTEHSTLSVRPAMLIDFDAFLFRLAVSFDIILIGGEPQDLAVDLFAGGGIGGYFENGYKIRPIISGGVELYWRFIAVLLPGINVEIRENDTDIELMLGIGFRF